VDARGGGEEVGERHTIEVRRPIIDLIVDLFLYHGQ
jgi:hypothetical protein